MPILKTLFLLLLLVHGVLYAMKEPQSMRSFFEEANVTGTFVLYDVQKRDYTVYNELRSKKRFVPASTFKIANSLIGLATEAVKDVNEPLPYTGSQNPFLPEWKRDMGLRDAIAISNVPIYQELARRIGLKRMQEHLILLQYGNADTGRSIDRFWLDGPLQISAVEQVQFLTKLAQNALPYPKDIQKSVKDILFIERGVDWVLYGKTGWYSAPGKGIGWFVGWLEKSDKLYIFALNIDMNNISDAEKRIELVKTSLAALGLFE